MNEIIEMRKNGATYQEIADAVGLSKQWVQQLITKHAPELKGTRGSARRRALDQVNRLQAEIKNLQERNMVLRGAVDTQKIEIERLQSQLYLAQYTDTAKRNIAAEAVKEFAEELKTRIKNAVFCCYDLRFKNHLQELLNIIVAKIDNLVKEMTEQSAGYGSSKKAEGNG